MKLLAFPYGAMVPELKPARARRDWMDAFPDRHAYRCLPLAIANSFGWELASPCDLRIDYNGGPFASDLQVSAEDGYELVSHFATSNFTKGILTLHTGYIFRTEPGWSLLATGPINEPRDGMVPLTGVIETDWLPYPFTMNYQLTRPGTFRIRKGEPFCHVVPILSEPVEQAEVEILPIEAETDLKERMDGFAARRGKLLGAGVTPDPTTVREAWGREYFRGKLADGTNAPRHTHKLRLADPVDRRNELSQAARTAPAPSEAPRSSIQNLALSGFSFGSGASLPGRSDKDRR